MTEEEKKEDAPKTDLEEKKEAAPKIDPEEQKRVNQAEWASDLNWGGPKNLAVYFSKRDSRTWVPQSKPSVGWTLNLAHTGGILWMVGICLGIILLLLFLVAWVFPDKFSQLF